MIRSNFHNYVNVIKYLRMLKFALSPEPRLSQSGHKRTGRNELPGDVGSARTWSEVGSAHLRSFLGDVRRPQKNDSFVVCSLQMLSQMSITLPRSLFTSLMGAFERFQYLNPVRNLFMFCSLVLRQKLCGTPINSTHVLFVVDGMLG